MFLKCPGAFSLTSLLLIAMPSTEASPGFALGANPKAPGLG